MCSLREETEDADKKALPVLPDRSRKASAEKRLDTVPDLESNKEGQGTPSPPPPPNPALYGWYCLLLEEDNRGSLACLCRGGKQQVGSGRAFFLDQFNKHDLQIESLHLGKALMSRKGIFLFPQSKVLVFPGASKTLWQTLAPRCFLPKQMSSAWGVNAGESGAAGPPFSFHLPVGDPAYAGAMTPARSGR